MSLSIAALRRMHAEALAECAGFIAQVDDLARPTPCAGWDLSALLGHMIGQNDGFAAAVRDGDADVAAFAPAAVELGTLQALWAHSSDRLVAAFEAAQPEAEVHLAEIGAPVSAQTALRMQVLDSAVHAWDVAASLRVRYRPANDVAVFVRDYARSFVRPAGTPGFFAPPLAELDEDEWDDGLRLLGRDPQWAPPQP